MPITTDAATTTGGESGIFALNIGSGALSITANTTGGVSFGIFAKTTGTGALSITTKGTTTSGQFDGIHAFLSNTASTGDLTINAATTTGGGDGIDARNYGSGALSITTTGTTTGTNYDGIYANNSSAGTLSRLTRPPRRAVKMALLRKAMAPAP